MEKKKHSQVQQAFIKYAVVGLLFLFIAGVFWWRQTSLDQRMTQQSEELQAENPPAPRPELDAVAPANAETDYLLGDAASADIILYEYVDLNCSFCKDYHQTLQTVTSQSEANLAWVIRHFPAQGTVERAAWMECVGDQQGLNAFWEYLERYYDEVTSTPAAQDDALFTDWLAQHGYDQLECDLDTYAQKVEAQFAEGKVAGIVGTPTLIIETTTGEREKVIGALEQPKLEQLITSYLPAN